MSDYLPGVTGPPTGHEVAQYEADLMWLEEALMDDSSGSIKQEDETPVEQTCLVVDQQDIVLFVARASSSDVNGTDATRDRLRASLELTRQDFETAYGTIPCTVEFLCFVQSSNHRFRSYVLDKFHELFAQQDAVGGRLIIVMNGFDGLSTHEVVLLDLLKDHTDMCDLFIFADDPRDESQPRRFFQANTEQVCQIIRGDINLIDGQEDVDELESGSGSGIVRDEELEFSTALYIRKIRHICEDKRGLSSYFQRLNTKTVRRNVNPNSRDLGKYPCDGRCGKESCVQRFATTELLAQHGCRSKNHNLECELGCGQKFKNNYSRNRHQTKSCTKRPNIEEGPKPKRARRQPATAPVSRVSDGGRLDYNGILQNLALVANLPPLITDEAVLVANGLPANASYRGDPIYRGELVCRWPGCSNRGKIFSSGKLRRHYEVVHKHEFPERTVGKAAPYIQKQHEDGLQYLAFSAQGITDVEKSWPEGY
ncbi:unnamed protein product [Penicillium pancosmium]